MADDTHSDKLVNPRAEMRDLGSRLEGFVLAAQSSASDRERLEKEMASMHERFQVETHELSEGYEKTLKDLRREMDEMSDALAASEAKREELRQERDALAAEVEPLKAELEELTAEVTRLTTQSR